MKVLDASAFLCFLQNESGADTVAVALKDECLMSAVNFAEVLRKLTGLNQHPDDAYKFLFDNFIVGGVIKVMPFSHLDAKVATELYPATKRYGLSLADRSCLSLAKQNKCQALTTDKVWSKLNVGIDIKVIR